jgi:hypothetical protein
MTKGKGKKKAATDSQETATPAKDCCIWSLDDKRKLVEYAVQHHAKGGNGMNFTKSFWVGAAVSYPIHSHFSSKVLDVRSDQIHTGVLHDLGIMHGHDY